jgi:hypothetical protein
VGVGTQLSGLRLRGKVVPPTEKGWRRFLEMAPISSPKFTELENVGRFWWGRRIPRDLLSRDRQEGEQLQALRSPSAVKLASATGKSSTGKKGPGCGCKQEEKPSTRGLPSLEPRDTLPSVKEKAASKRTTRAGKQASTRSNATAERNRALRQTAIQVEEPLQIVKGKPVSERHPAAKGPAERKAESRTPVKAASNSTQSSTSTTANKPQKEKLKSPAKAAAASTPKAASQTQIEHSKLPETTHSAKVIPASRAFYGTAVGGHAPLNPSELLSFTRQLRAGDSVRAKFNGRTVEGVVLGFRRLPDGRAHLYLQQADGYVEVTAPAELTRLRVQVTPGINLER